MLREQVISIRYNTQLNQLSLVIQAFCKVDRLRGIDRFVVSTM
jgi:hypothetical protein